MQKARYHHVLIVAFTLVVLATNISAPPISSAQAPNQVPLAVADSAMALFGEPIIINVLANDSDPDGDPLTITSFSQPWRGTVELVPGGFRYTATISTGLDSFAYTISDGRGGVTGANVTVAVNGVVPTPTPTTTPTTNMQNRPPIANMDNANTAYVTPVLINVLANDTDPDGDSLSITDLSPPGSGTVEVVSGKVRYIPNAGFWGVEAFGYKVVDGKGGYAWGTCFVGVQAPSGNPMPTPTRTATPTRTPTRTPTATPTPVNPSLPNPPTNLRQD